MLLCTRQGCAGDELHQLCDELLRGFRHFLSSRTHVQEVSQTDW